MQALLEILKAAIFGIVEGITEWLPISSTGHMILLNSTPLKLSVSDEFYSMFEVVIQLGAIMAVVITFWDQLWPWYLKKEKIPGRMASKSVPAWKKDAYDMWLKIIICCIPAAVVGVLFDDEIDRLFYHPIPVALALIIVGIVFIIVENTIAKNKAPEASSIAEMSFMMVWWIGVAQTIAAIFPGTSRSGATIIGALIVGASREAAAEFTFFLAVPVMLGASLLKVAKYIHAGVHMSALEGADLAVGCIVAFVVSMIVIRFFMSYIRKHDFKVFGWYRIALGALVIVLAASKVIS